jgi:putative FmdB family regulatory protein
MPIYEYKCEVCGTATEVLRPYASRAESLACGQCGAATAPILSRFSIPRSNQVCGYEPVPEQDGRRRRRSAGIRVENSTGVVIEDCTISNYETGISLDTKTSIAMNGNRFIGVARPIEVIDQ